MAKKSSRVLVGLVSTETGKQNYVTKINFSNTKDFQIIKYCPDSKKRVIHKIRKKLK